MQFISHIKIVIHQKYRLALESKFFLIYVQFIRRFLSLLLIANSRKTKKLESGCGGWSEVEEGSKEVFPTEWKYFVGRMKSIMIDFSLIRFTLKFAYLSKPRIRWLNIYSFIKYWCLILELFSSSCSLLFEVFLLYSVFVSSGKNFFIFYLTNFCLKKCFHDLV